MKCCVSLPIAPRPEYRIVGNPFCVCGTQPLIAECAGGVFHGKCQESMSSKVFPDALLVMACFAREWQGRSTGLKLRLVNTWRLFSSGIVQPDNRKRSRFNSDIDGTDQLMFAKAFLLQLLAPTSVVSDGGFFVRSKSTVLLAEVELPNFIFRTVTSAAVPVTTSHTFPVSSLTNLTDFSLEQDLTKPVVTH